MNHSNRGFFPTGFTLVETPAALSVTSVLMAIAAPSFSQLLANTRLSTASSTFVSHLQLARSEALKRGYKMVLCASNDGLHCEAASDWSAGYMVFADVNGNKIREDNEPILHVQQGQTGVRIQTTSGRKTLTYQADGMAPGSNVTVTFCDAKKQATSRTVIVSNTGRPRTATSSSTCTA